MKDRHKGTSEKPLKWLKKTFGKFGGEKKEKTFKEKLRGR